MTHVIGLRKTERLAMALSANFGGNGHRIQHFRRDDIPKIRRMAWGGASAAEIRRKLNIDMSPTTFSKRCRELQIKLCAKPGRNANGS